MNLGNRNFTGHEYGVLTGGHIGQWTQILCTQDAAFGGWDGAGNAFHEPWTRDDGRIAINLPKWSVVAFRRKRTEPTRASMWPSEPYHSLATKSRQYQSLLLSVVKFKADVSLLVIPSVAESAFVQRR